MKLLLTFIRKCSAPFLLICTFFFVATQAGLAQAIARAGLLDAMQIRPGVAVEIPIDIQAAAIDWPVDIAAPHVGIGSHDDARVARLADVLAGEQGAATPEMAVELVVSPR